MRFLRFAAKFSENRMTDFFVEGCPTKVAGGCWPLLTVMLLSRLGTVCVLLLAALVTDRVIEEGNPIGSVRLSVRPTFISTLSFQPSDL